MGCRALDPFSEGDDSIAKKRSWACSLSVLKPAMGTPISDMLGLEVRTAAVSDLALDNFSHV
jgi:hypothetical protein